MKTAPQAATLLPPAAVKQLQQAAQIPLTPNAAEPYLLRWSAINRATEQIKSQYPHLFKKEKSSES